MMPEFDWCNFCEHDNYGLDRCRRCEGEKPPSEFEERKSVTAYRKRAKELGIWETP